MGKLGVFFLFASELKSIRQHEHFKAEINRDALALYLRYNYVPAPYSIYKNIYKLLPGKMFVADLGDKCILNQEIVSFWSVKDIAESGANIPFPGTFDQAAELLNNLLANAVKLRMISDVPIGAFLSGGIDSSLVVALMQALEQQTG